MYTNSPSVRSNTQLQLLRTGAVCGPDLLPILILMDRNKIASYDVPSQALLACHRLKSVDDRLTFNMIDAISLLYRTPNNGDSLITSHAVRQTVSLLARTIVVYFRERDKQNSCFRRSA